MDLIAHACTREIAQGMPPVTIPVNTDIRRHTSSWSPQTYRGHRLKNNDREKNLSAIYTFQVHCHG